MFTSIADFVTIWQQESESTLKFLGQLTDKSLSQPIKEDFRTLGRIAWHIATSITEMMPKTGLSLKGPDPEAPVPESATEIRRSNPNGRMKPCRSKTTCTDIIGSADIRSSF